APNAYRSDGPASTRRRTLSSGAVVTGKEAGPFVELLDQRVNLADGTLDAGPVVVVVPLRLDLLVRLALLFDPGVVLEIVDTLALIVAQFFHISNGRAEQIAVIGAGRIQRGELALLLSQLAHAALVHFHRVRRHAEHDVIAAQLVILGELDG